jgi:hypothetical protein
MMRGKRAVPRHLFAQCESNHAWAIPRAETGQLLTPTGHKATTDCQRISDIKLIALDHGLKLARTEIDSVEQLVEKVRTRRTGVLFNNNGNVSLQRVFGLSRGLVWRDESTSC